MTKSLQELIERAYDIECYFSLGSYEFHHYEDGSFIDFKVMSVGNVDTLLQKAGGLQLKFFAGSDYMIVRLLERYEEI